jgi:hypothetical protein
MNFSINSRLSSPFRSASECRDRLSFSITPRKPQILLATAVAAIAFGSADLGAQQSVPYGWYSAAPQGAQQYDNAQPQYQQSYPQQPYAQPKYPQPQDAQPQYQQQPYPQQYEPSQQFAQPEYPQPQDAPQQQGAPAQPLNAGDLEQMLAPIALYPDALLAQVLAASTYPAQVSIADQWLNNMRAQGTSSPDQIAAGAQAQSSWDPSVKALTAFPQVLDMMDQNLEWTTNLGNAYYNQPQDVMQTVQVLRDRAQQAGNLQNTPQEQVNNDQGYIELAPPNPQVVYVPAYNPWDVYGQPIAPYPGFSVLGALGSVFGGSPIQFGLGIAMAAFEHTPFGWMGWGLDWLAHAIFFNHSPYFSHSTTVADWGFPHGGPRAYGGRNWAAGGYRGAQPYGRDVRTANSYGRSLAESHVSGERFGAGNGLAHGYQAPYRAQENYRSPGGYTHPATPGQQAYNRMPQRYAYARPQGYAEQSRGYAGGNEYYNHPGGAYGNAGRPAQSYVRPGGGYSGGYQPYRAPSLQSPGMSSSRAYAGRPGEAYGNPFARNQNPGGSHFFGGGRESGAFGGGQGSMGSYGRGFGGGGHAPKGFGHEKAPKASHSGGGGGHRHSR